LGCLPRRAGGRRRLHHNLLAGPAGVFRPADHDHAELGRHDVEAFSPILADSMQRAPAAGTSLVLDVDDLLNPRQMRRQRAAVGAPLPIPAAA
jgi:hypothetical protein